MAIGKYGASSALLDYIYGITFEIWEEKGVELIRQYYAEEIPVWALSGVSHTCDEVVDGTYAMLKSFPDRLLLAENVVWDEYEHGAGQYSSHRIMSPMTYTHESIYGPATGQRVQVRTVADCLVHDGKIIEEWLIRDTLPLARQLNAPVQQVAHTIQSSFSDATREWFAQELARTEGQSQHRHAGWARSVLESQWLAGQASGIDTHFAPYAVSYPDPLTTLSGSGAIATRAAELQQAFAVAQVKIDHVASQPWAHEGEELAVRWTLSATHVGDYQGCSATQRPVFILGSSHWRVVNNKILTEWVVFDQMAVVAQLV